MAIRVVARIRPRRATELEEDVIVTTGSDENASTQSNLIQLPNPKNQGEAFSFQLHNVYDSEATQQRIFDSEIAPTIKHLFGANDVTIFAYGSTGSGKTHTMRGGKTMAERGIIPRLLSGIYRRVRKIDKDSGGQSKASVSLSYYEIYNDKVFDLFESHETRSTGGLSLRDDGTKTTVVGLTERPCETLKQFERLYEEANMNRSTSATKLNAISSRSHAILGIKIAIVSKDGVQISVASAIDLAGSEDNRKTDNGKERMVESASINKSLFTLAKCVEAISQNQSRVPYRESKMTRILKLGQNNNGLTIMILNVSPTRAFYQDTLCSLKFASRTTKIQVKESENRSILKGCQSASSKQLERQPLRPLPSTIHNICAGDPRMHDYQNETVHRAKHKTFAVYSDQKTSLSPALSGQMKSIKKSTPVKRPLDRVTSFNARPPKRRSPGRMLDRKQPAMSKQAIEDIIERKVADLLAARALDHTLTAPPVEIDEAIQRRLEFLEQKIQGKGEGREEGLTFLLCAKQHAIRGEDRSALKMFTIAQPYFPNNKKLDQKIQHLQEKLQLKRQAIHRDQQGAAPNSSQKGCDQMAKQHSSIDLTTQQVGSSRPDGAMPIEAHITEKTGGTCKASPLSNQVAAEEAQSPGTKNLLSVINSRDVAQIRLLPGIGLKKAEGIANALHCLERNGALPAVTNLDQLGQLKGLGTTTVGKMRGASHGSVQNPDPDASVKQ